MCRDRRLAEICGEFNPPSVPMKRLPSFRLLILFICLLLSQLAAAQITTATLSGKVVDAQGGALPGATVVVTHVPTGTRRGAATEADGRFTIPNLTAGGPYSVEVSSVGYTTERGANLYLTLGNTLSLSFTLAPETTQLNEVVVTGSTEATKTGAGTNINREQLRTLPSISRSIQDFTRLDPRNSNNSFAGSNFRYNNITLDGAINNDAIGFSPSQGGVSGTSGLPGGSARANPISLDAIQQIQASVAPFDVKLGNFTGGSVNAVTRSGTNEVVGSIYGFGRNQAVTGKAVEGDRTRIGSSYHDYQTGFRLGLPILKDKLFLFTNAELTRRREPVFYPAGQGTVVSTDLAQRISQDLQQKYGYNVGDYGAYAVPTNSEKVFVRLDYNLDNKTSIALRHNYIKATAGNLERSATLFKFGSQDYTQNNLQNSTVLEVKSNFSNALANNLVLGYTNIHDYRSLLGGQAALFPAVQINNVGTGANDLGSGQILLGSDREASIFNQRQKTFEITDNVTFYKGRHALTLGTHNELYKIDYGFINSWNGRIEYNNVADFLADRPNRVRGSIRNGNNGGDNSYDYNYNHPSASFRINMYSLYLQDEYAVTDRLKVSPGLRFDVSDVPTKPELSPLVGQTNDFAGANGATYAHTAFGDFRNNFLGKVQFSPRLGFNYDVKGDGSVVLRGGSGIFTGRIPFAWLGYAFYNNGVNFNGVDQNNIQAASYTGNKTITLNQDPTKIYQQLPASAQTKTEINLIDNNFRMPQVWRSSLALDYTLPGGVRATVEGLYTKVIKDVKFEQINLKDDVAYLATGPTETPRYLGSGDGQRLNPAFSNFFLLTNTNKGYRYQLTGQLAKSLPQGFDLSAAYTYGRSYDLSNGIRNSPQSNWELNPARVPNSPTLAFSNFDLRHRVVSTIGYRKSYAQRFTSSVSLVLVYQSGSPYTYVYNNNFFNNGQQNVQLAYVPSGPGDVLLLDPATKKLDQTGQQYAALKSYIEGDKYLSSRRGQYTERNAARTPWNNQTDIRLLQEIRLGSAPDAADPLRANHPHSLQITFDIMNVGNLLNRNWGRQYFVPNTFNSTAAFGLAQSSWADAAGNLSPSFSAATFNRPVFTYTKPSTTPYSIDQLASRWQGQLGLRYSF